MMYVVYWDLRHQLFGKHHRRHNRSRSPYRNQSHEERSHRSHSRKHDDRDHHESRSRRHKSTSPAHRRGRSWSPGWRRHRSPVRDGSEERCTRIEQWNSEKEEQDPGNKTKAEDIDNGNSGHSLKASKFHGHQLQEEEQQSPNEAYWSAYVVMVCVLSLLFAYSFRSRQDISFWNRPPIG